MENNKTYTVNAGSFFMDADFDNKTFVIYTPDEAIRFEVKGSNSSDGVTNATTMSANDIHKEFENLKKTQGDFIHDVCNPDNSVGVFSNLLGGLSDITRDQIKDFKNKALEIAKELEEDGKKYKESCAKNHITPSPDIFKCQNRIMDRIGQTVTKLQGMIDELDDEHENDTCASDTTKCDQKPDKVHIPEVKKKVYETPIMIDVSEEDSKETLLKTIEALSENIEYLESTLDVKIHTINDLQTENKALKSSNEELRKAIADADAEEHVKTDEIEKLNTQIKVLTKENEALRSTHEGFIKAIANFDIEEHAQMDEIERLNTQIKVLTEEKDVVTQAFNHSIEDLSAAKKEVARLMRIINQNSYINMPNLNMPNIPYPGAIPMGPYKPPVYNYGPQQAPVVPPYNIPGNPIPNINPNPVPQASCDCACQEATKSKKDPNSKDFDMLEYLGDAIKKLTEVVKERDASKKAEVSDEPKPGPHKPEVVHEPGPIGPAEAMMIDQMVRSVRE